MRVYAIGDVHLPGGPRAKGMERFDPVWTDHPRVIAERWNDAARDDDVLLIVGDLSWAMTIEEARDDLAWIDGLRGTKVVVKGNHDFWWKSIGKVRAAFGESVHALQYDHVVLGPVAFVGTRGWQCPGSIGSADLMHDGKAAAGTTTYTEQDRKLYEREVGRLKMAFERLEKSGASWERLVCLLHYPPMNPEHEPSGFTELIDRFGVDVCVHGHLHGAASIATAFEGRRGRTEYHCVSADAVRMAPRRLLEVDGETPD